MDKARCDNCGTIYSVDQLAPIHDLWDRIDPSTPRALTPAGECPDSHCGALCYVAPFWACQECGSTDVQETAWIWINTGENTGGDGPFDHCWCDQCEMNTGDGEIKDIARTAFELCPADETRIPGAELVAEAALSSQPYKEGPGRRYPHPPPPAGELHIHVCVHDWIDQGGGQRQCRKCDTTERQMPDIVLSEGPDCGHGACSQHYIDTGDTHCIALPESDEYAGAGHNPPGQGGDS